MKKIFKYIVLATFLIFVVQSCNVLNHCSLEFKESTGGNYEGYYIVKCNDSIGFIDLSDSADIYTLKPLTDSEERQVNRFIENNKAKTVQFNDSIK